MTYIVLGEIDFLGGPERGLGLLVHLPDLVVLDGEEDKAVGVLLEERLVLVEGKLLKLLQGTECQNGSRES